MKTVLICFLFLASFPAWGMHRIHGVLRGHNGTLLPKGVVSICSLVDRQRVSLAEADALGAFSITIEHEGLYEIQLVGVGHIPVIFPIHLRKAGESRFRIELAPRVWTTPPSKGIRLEGSLDGETLSGPRFLLEAKDGVYRTTFNAKDSLRYKLYPLGHNPKANGFLFDGAMDFYSVQPAVGGLITIVIQASDFPSEKLLPKVITDDSEATALLEAQDIFEGLSAQFGGLVQSQRRSYLSYLEQHRRSSGFIYDGSKEIVVMEGHLKSAKIPLVQEYWILHIWRHFLDCRMTIPSDVQERALRVSPASPAWALISTSLADQRHGATPASPWLKAIKQIQYKTPNKDLANFLGRNPNL